MADRNTDPRARRLAERALKERATLPLAALLEAAVPVAALRALASDLALSPKGFRIERAPARVLAPLLAERTDPAELERVVALLLPTSAPKADESETSESDESEAVDHKAALRLQEQEVRRLRDELERARETSSRAAERESTMRQHGDQQEHELQQLRTEVKRLQNRPSTKVDPGTQVRDLQHRVRDLEQELEARVAADEALRRQLAVERTTVRSLEDEVKELEALLPKGRRRKVAAPPPPEPARFRVPHFLPSFYKSLVGKERKSVERAVQAVLLFCTEGPAYPGLEVKKLGGQETWSLRASLGLRVYFENRDDGDVDVLGVADREEQMTTLKGLKDR